MISQIDDTKGKYYITIDEPKDTGSVYIWYIIRKTGDTCPTKYGKANTKSEAESNARSALLSLRHNLVIQYLINRNKKGINCKMCKTPEVKEIDYVYEYDRFYCDVYYYTENSPIRTRIINGKCYDDNQEEYYSDTD